MNQQIEKLFDQALAEFQVENKNTTIVNPDPLQRDFVEKFARLIVAECMEVFSKDLPEPGDGKMLEVINRVCAVAEHFGVEE